MENRTSSNQIKSLRPNEVFVFGSNLAGIHGAGAALLAYKKFGAIMYRGIGEHGESYALPTKDGLIHTLPLHDVTCYVNEFIEHAKSNPDKTYLVTEVGCGLAGFTPEQIAPLFKAAVKVANIHLPASFWQLLTK